MTAILLALLPWYAWAGIAVVLAAAIAAVIYTGMWPVVLAVVRKIPPKAYIAAAVALILLGLHLSLEGRALAKRDADHAAAVTALKAAHAAELEQIRLAFQKQIKDARDAAQAQLDDLGAQLRASDQARETERQAAETKRLADLVAMKKGFQAYVSPIQIARCADVPRGYLVRRANAAAYANGVADTAGPPASPASLDEPSGVSLATVDAVDIDAAGAFRACRERVLDWERYGDQVDRYVTRLKSILEAKGATP